MSTAGTKARVRPPKRLAKGQVALRLPDAVIVCGDSEYMPTPEMREGLMHIIEQLSEDPEGGILLLSYPATIYAKDVVRFKGRKFRIVPLKDDEEAIVVKRLVEDPSIEDPEPLL